MIKVEETSSQLKVAPSRRGSAKTTCVFQSQSTDKSTENGGILKQSPEKVERINSRLIF